MKLYLVKPDLTYYEQYNEMMTEWYESKTHIAPWFLGEPMQNPEEFEALIRMLDNCEHGIVAGSLKIVFMRRMMRKQFVDIGLICCKGILLG